MFSKKNIVIIALTACVAINIPFAFSAEKQAVKPTPCVNIVSVNPIQLVDSPSNYLNKKIKIEATFDKFSTLGLDYKGAFKDSQKYISFLIRRNDVTDYDIPLSELKLIISRDKAEKLIDIETGDKIEFSGTVFSTALNDPWVEVDNVKILTQKTAKTSKEKPASSEIK